MEYLFLLGGLFVLIAINNAVLWWRQFVLKRERTPSVLPLVGGVLGYVGLRASPAEVISNYAWLALLLDVGCGPYLLLGLVFLVPELWSTSRINLLREYLGQQDIKRVYLRLFRRGIFTIQQHFQRPPGELGHAVWYCRQVASRWYSADSPARGRERVSGLRGRSGRTVRGLATVSRVSELGEQS